MPVSPADFTDFIKVLPEVLKELDPTQKMMGMTLMLLPVILWIGLRDMTQPRKGYLTIGSLFGVLAVSYLFLSQDAKLIYQENPTQEEFEPTSPPSQNQSGSYIFPDSSERRLDETDLAGMDKAKLALARNEIYARNGRYFKSEYFRNYFEQFDWYKPDTWEPNLNRVEEENIQLILKHEKS